MVNYFGGMILKSYNNFVLMKLALLGLCNVL